MAAKKKIAAKKIRTNKVTSKKKPAKKKASTKKKKKRTTTKKASNKKKKKASKKKKKTSRAKAGTKRSANLAAKPKPAPKKRSPARKQALDPGPSKSQRMERFADSDSQGLSDVEISDSESVSELVDEGNTFEAGVVSGVERAENADEREVRTREFPEDDVPQEYLDED